MDKFKQLFKNKLLIAVIAQALIILVLIVGIVVVITHKPTTEQVTENKLENLIPGYDSSRKGFSGSVVYTDYAVWYLDEEQNPVGPFLFVYEDDIKAGDDLPVRYLGENSLIGYLNRDGSILSEPVYRDGAAFESGGTAMVTGSDGRIYYIDTEGKRISKYYRSGYSFERNGQFARVQLMNNTWGIINRKGQLMVQGLEFIGELSSNTTIGTALMDGHAILFRLLHEGSDEFAITNEFEDFVEISDMYEEKYADVMTEDGLMGCVDIWGRLIMDPVYTSIERVFITGGNFYNTLVLVGTKEDGTHVRRIME